MFRQIAISSFIVFSLSIIANAQDVDEGLVNGLNFDQRFEFFKISGRTSLEIFRDFQKKSPIKGVGNYQATLGVANIKMIPEVQYVKSQGRCEVAKSSINVHVVIHLPEWSNYEKADDLARLSWDNLFADIKRHELVHAEIARDYGTRIQNRIAALGPRRSCNSLDRSVTRAAKQLLNKHDKAQKRFDRDELRKRRRRAKT